MSISLLSGDRLTLNFSLALEDGSVIDSNFEGDPVQLTIGDGNMLPGFEAALSQFLPGAKSTTTIDCEQAFGEYNEDNVQRFKPTDFDGSIEIAEGLVVGFSDPAGGELAGVVRSIDSDYITVDFNHPLAGRRILFTVLIHSVERSN